MADVITRQRGFVLRSYPRTVDSRARQRGGGRASQPTRSHHQGDRRFHRLGAEPGTSSARPWPTRRGYQPNRCGLAPAGDQAHALIGQRGRLNRAHAGRHLSKVRRALRSWRNGPAIDCAAWPDSWSTGLSCDMERHPVNRIRFDARQRTRRSIQLTLIVGTTWVGRPVSAHCPIPQSLLLRADEVIQ